MRRYAAGFSPIVGFEEPAAPDFASLARYCEPGERFYCIDGPAPALGGWSVDVESTMFQMVWDGAAPAADACPEALPLRAEHAEQAVALAALTRPGPFGPRTIELGEYFGCFDGSRLLAMAGERMTAGRLREISGVCTRPDAQGRGLARRLMLKLLRRQLLRDELPFLHVMRDNAPAIGLYERMGFRVHREPVVRVVSLR